MNTVKGPDGQVVHKFDWPSNNGALGGENMRTLQPKTVVTRYGSPEGNFASPQGTPFADRALPNSYSTKAFNSYEVIKPISVHESLARPWFNQPGMGTQWRFNNTIEWYLQNGYLK